MNEDLPEDLARPRPDRASFIANIATATVLLLMLAGLLAFVAVT